MRSIRQQLSYTLLLALFLLFTLFSAGLYLFSRKAFIQQFDEALIRKIVALSRLSEIEERDGAVALELEFEEFPMPEFQPSSDAEYYQVWSHDHSVLSRSPSLLEKNLPMIEGTMDEPSLVDIDLPDGRLGRGGAIWTYPVPEPGEEPPPGYIPEAPENHILLVIARSREDLDHTLGVLLVGHTLMGLLLGLVLVLLIRSSVRKGLLPLKRIADEIRTIDPSDLSHRFGAFPLPQELTPVCSHLNSLLERLDAALQREKRFSRDVSHELRTPIAELRTLAEVALKREPDNGYAGIAREYFHDVLEITLQMERLVTALLSIVRCDASRQTTRKEPVEMRDLIREISNPYREEARARNIVFELSLPDTAMVESDSSLLIVVFKNLFANAINHTPEGGEVHAELATDTDSLLFTIANTNDQIEPDDLGLLFDPFWRKDPSRSGESGHGLGLSVVKSCTDLLGLRVQASLKDPHLVSFQIRIPRPSALQDHYPIETTETE